VPFQSMKNPKKLFPRHTTIEEHPTTICHRLPAVVFKYPFFNEGIKAYRMKEHAITNETLDAIDIIPNKQLAYFYDRCISRTLSYYKMDISR